MDVDSGHDDDVIDNQKGYQTSPELPPSITSGLIAKVECHRRDDLSLYPSVTFQVSRGQMFWRLDRQDRKIHQRT